MSFSDGTSFMSEMFSGDIQALKKDLSGNVIIDRNLKIFEFVLDYIRYGPDFQPDHVDDKKRFELELKYWGLASGSGQIKEEIKD